MKRIILITLLAVGVLVLGTSVAKADETSNYPPIVSKLVERFGLNEAEVKAVFDEQRTERQAEKQAEREEKLSQAVSDGVITEEQKQALISKHEEMRTNKPEKGEFKEMSKEERQSIREEHRTEMQSWFDSQGIDHKALREYMGGPKNGPSGGKRPGFGR